MGHCDRAAGGTPTPALLESLLSLGVLVLSGLKVPYKVVVQHGIGLILSPPLEAMVFASSHENASCSGAMPS